MEKGFTIAGVAAAALIAMPVTAWAVTPERSPTTQTPCGIEWDDMTRYMSTLDGRWSDMLSLMEERGTSPGTHMTYGGVMMGFGPSGVPGS